MAENAIYRVKMRRRRESKTDYRKRLALLKSEKPRIIVRRTNKRIIIQVAEYHEDGDRILLTVTSDMLREYGWNRSYKSIPAAYLAGYLAGKRAIKWKIGKAVLDIGRHPAIAGTKLFATLKGMVDAGMDIPHAEDMYPSDERIVGKHIGDDVEKMFNEVKSKLEV